MPISESDEAAYIAGMEDSGDSVMLVAKADGRIIGNASNSFEMFELQVRSDNVRAIRLYEKFGFQKTGTHPAFFKMDGKYIAFDYMSLLLQFYEND